MVTNDQRKITQHKNATDTALSFTILTRGRNCLPCTSTWVHPRFLVGSLLLICLVFCVVVFGGILVSHLFSFLCCVFRACSNNQHSQIPYLSNKLLLPGDQLHKIISSEAYLSSSWWKLRDFLFQLLVDIVQRQDLHYTPTL